MIRHTSFKLIVLLTITILISNSIFASSAYALSSDLLSKENILSVAKGVAAIYLLSRVNSLMNEKNDARSSSVEEKVAEEYYDLVIDPLTYNKMSGKVILLDPGHGGHDPGAVGKRGLKEKDLTLDIALRVFKLLKTNTSARVYLTRDSDQFISLYKRSEMANNLNADTFISIHINGAENGIERGIETYAHYNSSKKSWALAWYLQDSLVRELGFIDRGLKAENFHVVRETNMDSVLLEIGFITEPAEERLLSQNSIREKAALAIFRGILDYYSKS
ncbi:MAG: N-acetylmuramoyl-L-alanine amidase [Halanaerobiales bacterium]